MNPTPKVNLRYGAPMGRASDNLSALQVLSTDPRFTLRSIRIDSGGYDTGGTYWGIGAPLFWWAIIITEGDSVDECSGFFRARNREAAKAHVLGLQKHARFYR